VLTSDAETAAATANAAGADDAGRPWLVALTGAPRSARILAASRPEAAAMPFDVAAALLRRSALSLAAVRQAIIAMPDAPNDPLIRDALDAAMAELPRDAVRTLVAAAESPDVEALVSRHFFKARRTRESSEILDAREGLAIRTVTTSAGARWDSLRRLLDELDPASAVVVSNAQDLAQATRTLATMGYADSTQFRAVTGLVPDNAALVVFAGMPAAAVLRSALDASHVHVVVLCAPREIASLRALANNVPVVPWPLDGPRAQATAREAATRARLREILASGAYSSELLSLTPLLDEFDASELAAAALVLASEFERRSPAAAVPPPAPLPRREPAGPRDRPPHHKAGPVPRRDRR
jgi:hypothetical protein